MDRIADGSVTILPARTTSWADVDYDNGFFRAEITSFSGDSTDWLSSQMLDARAADEPFPGYLFRGAPEGTDRRRWYDMDVEHCGFDGFERPEPRLWHWHDLEEALAPTPDDVFPPFDQARLFGWPAGRAGGYSIVAECRNHCVLEATLTSYLTVKYRLDHEFLCDAPEIIEAHMDWVFDHIVDEETAVLNPKYQ